VNAIPATQEELRREMTNPQEIARAAAIERATAVRMQGITDTITLRREQGFDAAAFLVAGTGKAQMDLLRNLIGKELAIYSQRRVELGDRLLATSNSAATASLVATEMDRLCLPLVTQGDVIGCLTVTGQGLTSGAEDQRAWIGQLAEQLGLALSNVRLRVSLRQQSIVDPLTQLYNRRYMDEVLKRELARSSRNGSPLAALVHAADLALYEAKHSGRNCVRVAQGAPLPAGSANAQHDAAGI
jgi:GAF domain-containing protein